MSRHANLKHLIDDAYAGNDGYYDEYGGENDLYNQDYGEGDGNEDYYD